ncbi:hypothetical protein [uncultured Cetobacterium sp.]|uniref:hypothetical protein n=1 Tax=uncultured Cetobacterium sp. TaxID=527638 RepID=UPI0026028017|nr:hypothetical protein [uncultured Cetobacterium sp.]
MAEYKVLNITGMNAESIQNQMNIIYKDGWNYKETVNYILNDSDMKQSIMIFEINRQYK